MRTFTHPSNKKTLKRFIHHKRSKIWRKLRSKAFEKCQIIWVSVRRFAESWNIFEKFLFCFFRFSTFHFYIRQILQIKIIKILMDKLTIRSQSIQALAKFSNFLSPLNNKFKNSFKEFSILDGWFSVVCLFSSFVLLFYSIINVTFYFSFFLFQKLFICYLLFFNFNYISYFNK